MATLASATRVAASTVQAQSTGRLPRRQGRVTAAVCRAQLGPEDAEPRQWNGPSSSSSWQPLGGVPSSSSSSQSAGYGAGARSGEWDEEPLMFCPDLDTPPVLVQDWRAFRARLVAMESGQTARAASMQLGREERWAHVLTQPERGCLLVARPREGLGMFKNTVILLLEHDDGEGSSGLVINMPTPLLVSQLGLEEDIAESFRQCPLFIGGPVTKNLLHVLHGRRDVEGALEIIEGVFAGGVESAAELVRRREADPREFMLLAGYSGWGPWQLQRELRAGTWLPVAASQAVIMDVLKESLSWSPEPQAVPRMGIGAALPSTSPFSSTAASTSGISCDDLKLLCWQRVLYRAGIEPHMLGML
ncbi:hypothetical protein C2E21_8585 [Chlorella sorokiniana]|uniref:Transcriptional regulator n=1 Tax=Chlorella sorokiniana TaxID=3076 RepID=A0A2P6TDS0_CHLSO|nr:hypothetical protein C2E21_8585 [Chlorella sorokiniana]|eukprot:PRW20794.1 hypothetical protein C2E21_8585 [Chlorella sorokiniana]